MINEIKSIVQGYLNSIKLPKLVIGTVVEGGIKVSDKLVIPLELISGNFKKEITSGNRVRMLRDLGGQEFYILEIIDKDPVTEGVTINIEPITIKDGNTISNIKIKEVVK